MSDRNPHTAPAPGDRWRDEITGSVREICDVRTRANGKGGPLLVYYWVARQWEGKKNYVKRPRKNPETGESEMVDVFVGQDTAKTPARWKRVSLKRFTSWTVRPGVKYVGMSDQGTPKPGRVTFDMLPAHQAFPEKVALPANKAELEKIKAERTAAKAAAYAAKEAAIKAARK